jgi:hypothetical protein
MTQPDEQDGGARGGASEKKDKQSVTVVVNGAATVIAVHGNPTLLEIVATALEQTQNSGQPVENWELRTASGTLLTDLSTHIKSPHLADDEQLFLNLRAGIGG